MVDFIKTGTICGMFDGRQELQGLGDMLAQVLEKIQEAIRNAPSLHLQQK